MLLSSLTILTIGLDEGNIPAAKGNLEKRTAFEKKNIFYFKQAKTDFLVNIEFYKHFLNSHSHFTLVTLPHFVQTFLLGNAQFP